MKIIRLTESNNQYQWYKIYIAKILGGSGSVIARGSNIYYCYVWLSNNISTAYQQFQDTLNGKSTVISKYYTSGADKKKIATLKGYSILNVVPLGTTLLSDNLPSLGSILTSHNRNYRNKYTPYVIHHIDGFEGNNSPENKLYILPADFSPDKYDSHEGLNRDELDLLSGVHWVIEGSEVSRNNLCGKKLVAKLCCTNPYDTETTPEFFDVYVEIK